MTTPAAEWYDLGRESGMPAGRRWAEGGPMGAVRESWLAAIRERRATRQRWLSFEQGWHDGFAAGAEEARSVPSQEPVLRYVDAILAGKVQAAEAIAREVLERGARPERIFLELLQPAMRWIGQLSEQSRCGLIQARIAATLTERLVNQFESHQQPQRREPIPRVLLTTPEGEGHRLGLAILGAMLRQTGWEVLDPGPDVPLQSLLAIAAGVRLDALLVSVSSDTSLPAARALVAEIRRRDLPLAVGAGGSLFERQPELRALLGEYYWGYDAHSAVAGAESSLLSRPDRRIRIRGVRPEVARLPSGLGNR